MNPSEHDSLTNEEENQSRGESILFSHYMIWPFAALLGVSLWFNMIPFILISTFLLVISLTISIWKKRMWNHIHPVLHLSQTRLFNGQSFSIEASLSNEKWLPLVWLEWEHPRQPGILWGEEQKHHYIIRLLWLLKYQKISWDITGQAMQRGVYKIGDITLRSGDPFRLTEQEKKWPLAKTLYVYPELRSVTVPLLSASMPWEMRGKKGGIVEDPLLIQGVRDYESGDDWRNIDWRATAKTGELQTRMYEPIMTKQLIICLDVKNFYTYHTDQQEQHDLFERLLSIMASIAVRHHKRNVQVGYVTNALDKYRNVIAPSAPQQNLTPLLDCLAGITDYPAFDSIRLLDQLLKKGKQSIPVYMFCGAVTETHYQWFLMHKKQVPSLTFYYVRETEYAKKMGQAAQPAEIFLSKVESKGVES
ncbi:uncharacterized protein (DUF58 family) [Salibacterium salarium]|uniref:DUF58 domain-containing protein n=1 Tax=Salibacterium salarium TaxID=284579 RepID=UPI00277E1DC8|nr:DUF58 domain-containing protein [Salibacterium salarium]MDQ0297930.1 uncharacterized protein (DUF58 family) [Salibacterium salarium]